MCLPRSADGGHVHARQVTPAPGDSGWAVPGVDGFAGKAGGRFLGNDVFVITRGMGAWGSDTEFEAKFSSDTCSRSKQWFFLSLPAWSFF